MHPYLPKLYIAIYRSRTFLFTEVVHSYLPKLYITIYQLWYIAIYRLQAIQKYTTGFSFDTPLNYKSIVELALGLNYTDMAKACEETIKEMILSSAKKLHKNFLIDSLKNRKS